MNVMISRGRFTILGSIKKMTGSSWELGRNQPFFMNPGRLKRLRSILRGDT